jgi:hypothetical protein
MITARRTPASRVRTKRSSIVHDDANDVPSLSLKYVAFSANWSTVFGKYMVSSKAYKTVFMFNRFLVKRV